LKLNKRLQIDFMDIFFYKIKRGTQCSEIFTKFSNTYQVFQMGVE